MIDYGRFQRQRRPLWDRLERRLARLESATKGRVGRGGRFVGRRRQAQRATLSYGELEEVAFDYRQVLHDHALASHRFAGTVAARRLAALALTATRQLSRRRGRRGGLWRFATDTFPAAFRRQLGMLGIAVAIFAGAAVCGLLLSAVQPALGRMFLGERAMEDLGRGHLWTESVRVVPPAFTSSAIATNNLSVALGAWGGGVLAGAGPLFILVTNGLMLGAVVGVTLRFSMAGDLLTFIAAHGPLEITLILVAAAAGLSIGRAMVAAGDEPRGVALRRAAADSLRVMGGCLPWFVVLAIVESWISPNPDIALALKVALGMGLELFFLAAALAPAGAAGAADAAGGAEVPAAEVAA